MTVLTMLTLRLTSIMLCIAASYSHNPQIAIRALVGSTVNISCMFRGISTSLVMIYKHLGKDFEAIVKVAGECRVTNDLTLEVSCTCTNSEHVSCNITDFKSLHANDQWKCAFFVNNLPIFSNAAVPQKAESTAITQAYLLDVTNTTKVVYKTDDITFGSNEGTTFMDRSISPSKAVIASGEIWTTEVSISFTNGTNTETTSLPLRRISNGPNDTSNIFNDMSVPTATPAFFHESVYGTFIIIGVIGFLILLATNILICVCRQNRTHTDVTAPSLDDTANVFQINDNVRTTSDVNATERQCSLVDHYERIPIIDIPLIAENYPLSNEDSTHFNDTDFDNEEGANSLHYHVTIIDELESNFEETTCNDEGKESGKHNDPVRYEMLLKTASGEKPQYSILKSQ